MASHHQPDTYFVAGQRGTGKSGLSHALFTHWQTRGARLFVVDPTRDFAKPDHPGARYRLPAAWLDTHGLGDGAPYWEVADTAARDAWQEATASGQRSMLILDDANLSCTGPHQDGAPPWCKLLVHEGRHRNCGYLVSVRLPSEIPLYFRSEAAHRVVFKMTEPAQLRYLKDIGLEPRQVDSLPKGDFWHRREGEPWHLHKRNELVDVKGRMPSCLTDPL